MPVHLRQRRVAIRSAVALAALLAVVPAAPADEPTVELEEVAWSPVRRGVLRGVVAAPAERVYRALVDFAHWHEFMPFVAVSTATPAADGGVRCRQRLELPFPYRDRDYRLHASHGADPAAGEWWVRWQDVARSPAGDEVRGGETRAVVRLSAAGAGDGTAIEVRLWSDGGGLLPRGLQERLTARSLEWILDGLRQQVGRCRYDRPRAPSCAEDPPFTPPPRGAENP